MAFPQALSRLRREKGFTQKQMAARIGIGAAQVSRYEKGRSSPTLEVIRKIAREFGVSTDELIFDESERVASARIRDPQLLEQFERISRLAPGELKAVKTLLDGMIPNRRGDREPVVPSGEKGAWSGEMRTVVEEFRRSSGPGSDEEAERLVDEAVFAVRNGD